jgi:acetyl-CoA carboxylase carboxyltransferase component
VTNPAALLEALKQALGFEAQGERAGNVTPGRGRLDGREVRVALVENHAASGAIGAREAAALGELLAKGDAPLVLYLDSAGAKVSEGLQALGAFRALYRAGLAALLRGTPIAAVLGRNCYGGSSMLAHLAARRLFHPNTQLAMSGPAIIASAAGMNPLDDMFRAMATATLGAPGRAATSAANAVWDPAMDLSAWLREPAPAP